MKKALTCVIALALVIGLCAGCSERAGTNPDAPPMADNFMDNAPKYHPAQRMCPACGGQPIKQKFHADHQGKRIYFDKEECVQEFKQDPQKVLQGWMEKVQKAMMSKGGKQSQEK